DRAACHVGQRRLLAAGGELVSKSHFAFTEKPKQAWSAPLRNAFEFSLGAEDLEAVASHLENQVAAILPLSALGFGEKVRAAAAEHDVDLLLSRQLLSDVRPTFARCVKGRRGRVRQAAIRRQPDRAPSLPGKVDEAGQSLVVRADAETAVVHLYSRCQCR